MARIPDVNHLSLGLFFAVASRHLQRKLSSVCRMLQCPKILTRAVPARHSVKIDNITCTQDEVISVSCPLACLCLISACECLLAKVDPLR